MQNPWLDIASYQLSDRNRFKGRTGDIDKFSQIVNNGTFSVLYADSGIGKTSFINAGIEPIVIQNDFLPIHILFDEDIFLSEKNIEKWIVNNIESKFYATIGNEKFATHSWEFVYSASDEIEELKNNLWWRMHSYCIIDKESNNRLKPFIVFDQFEEVFTKGNKGFLKSFFSVLEVLSSNTIPQDVERILSSNEKYDELEIERTHQFKVLFSLRKEYLSDFDHWGNDIYSITELFQNRMLLNPLSRKQARQVICEQDGVNTLDEIAENIIERIDEKHHDAVEPFILSVLCSRLYEKAAHEQRSVLHSDDLEKIGIRNVLSSFYEEKITSLVLNEKHRSVIETQLVDEDGYRRRERINSKTLSNIDFDNKYLKSLENAHIIRIVNINDNKCVEIVHDRIAEIIKEKNARRKEYKKRFVRLAVIWCIFVVLAILSTLSIVTGDISRFIDIRSNYVNILPHKKECVELDSLSIRKNYIGEEEVKELQVKSCNISDMAFMGCQNLESITIASSKGDTIVIGERAFEGCVRLKSINLDGDFYVDIREHAFDNCINLEQINLYNAVEIGDYAFKGCRSLKTITTGKNLETIGYESFANCEKIINFKIGSKVSTIRNSAFVGCPNINFGIHNDNHYFVWHDNSLLYNVHDLKFEYDNKIEKAIIYSRSKIVKDRNGNSSIIHYAHSFPEGYNQESSLSLFFEDIKDNSADRELNIYNEGYQATHEKYLKLSTIGNFENSPYIEVLDLSNCEGDYIPDDAFKNCINLKQIIWPDSISIIGSSAFEGCISLTKLDLSKTKCPTISNNAFARCKNLSSVSLPDSLRYLGDHAFDNCSLTNVDMSNIGMLCLGASFTNNNNLHCFIFPKKLEYLDFELFKGCDSLKNVTLPISIQYENESIEKNGSWFGYDGFCTGTKVNIPSSSHFSIENNMLFYDYKGKHHISCLSFLSKDLKSLSLYKNGGLYSYRTDDMYYLTLLAEDVSSYTIEEDAIIDLNIIKLEDLERINFSKSRNYICVDSVLFPRCTQKGETLVNVAKNVIYDWGNSQIMRVPTCVLPQSYTLENGGRMSNLRELHIPFTMAGFDLNGDSIDKSQITLFVPHGSINNYKASSLYIEYKEIKEDGVFTMINNILDFSSYLLILFFITYCIFLVKDVSILEKIGASVVISSIGITEYNIISLNGGTQALIWVFITAIFLIINYYSINWKNGKWFKNILYLYLRCCGVALLFSLNLLFFAATEYVGMIFNSDVDLLFAFVTHIVFMVLFINDSIKTMKTISYIVGWTSAMWLCAILFYLDHNNAFLWSGIYWFLSPLFFTCILINRKLRLRNNKIAIRLKSLFPHKHEIAISKHLPNIYCCYSHKDFKVVQAVTARLRRKGFNPWMDSKQLLSGDFAQQILSTIENSEVILFFSSEASNSSQWIKSELAYSIEYEKTIIPIRLDDSDYNTSIRLYLQNVQSFTFDSIYVDTLIDKLQDVLLSCNESF